jgi:hypothetical protein
VGSSRWRRIAEAPRAGERLADRASFTEGRNRELNKKLLDL